MARFTKLQRSALLSVIGEVQAGDPGAYFNGGCEVASPPKGKDQRLAVRLAGALSEARDKIVDEDIRADRAADRRKGIPNG